MKTKKSPAKYFALKDTMFGIKKGDSLTYDYVKKTFTHDRTNKNIPIDPAIEPTYFEIEMPTLYKRDDILMLKTPTSFRPTVGGGNFTIPAFEPLRVTNVKRIANSRKDNIVYTVKIENAAPTKTFQYEIAEGILVPYVMYHFINSKGMVCKDVEGKDPKADNFRKLTSNKFATLEEAAKRLKELV